MKKYLLYLAAFVALSSCNIGDDDGPSFYLEIMPIQSVDIASEFILGETHEISMTYTIPNDCYEFNDFIYQTNLNERTIAVVNTVYTNQDCMGSTEQVDVSIDFQVNSLETYVFRFYQGSDTQGQDQYYIVEVPVVEPED